MTPPPSGPVNMATQTGDWQSLLPGPLLFVLCTKLSSNWYLEGRAETPDFQNFPCCYVVSLFFFFIPPPECPSSQQKTAGFELWAERCLILCLPSWSISPCLTSLDEYDSSAEELEILCALFFLLISFSSFSYFCHVGRGARLTRNKNVKWQRNKFFL